VEVRLATSKGMPALPFQVAILREGACQPVPDNWFCKVVLLFHDCVKVGVPLGKVIVLAVITLVQVLEAYCAANESSPVLETLGFDKENEVVSGAMEIAIFEKADDNEDTIWLALPVTK